jgi:hypothetical protein
MDDNSFGSTNDKRVNNNPVNIDNYTGPDDVALRYKTLSDKDKENMLRVKMAAQNLINILCSLNTHIDTPRDIQLAIEHAQDASMRGTRFITQTNKQ